MAPGQRHCAFSWQCIPVVKLASVSRRGCFHSWCFMFTGRLLSPLSHSLAKVAKLSRSWLLWWYAASHICLQWPSTGEQFLHIAPLNHCFQNILPTKINIWLGTPCQLSNVYELLSVEPKQPSPWTAAFIRKRLNSGVSQIVKKSKTINIKFFEQNFISTPSVSH